MLNSISIIIVNYNGAQYLKNTISSCVNIFRHNGFDDFELLILDNASTDNSVDVIHDVLGGLPFLETTFIKSKVNHGFAKGCNILSKIAKREILYFLNNDTMSLDASEFIGLIRAGDFKDNSVWAFKTLNSDGTRQNNVFRYPTRSKFLVEMVLLKNKLHFLLKKMRFSTFKDNYDSSYFSGCALLISKNVFLQLNGFDEEFYFYHEECDLFIRLEQKFNKKLDKKLLNDEIIHYGGGGGIISDFSFVAYYTNLYRLYLKHGIISQRSLNFIFKFNFLIKKILYLMNIQYEYSPFAKTYKISGSERNPVEVYELQMKLMDNIKREFNK